MFSQIGGASLDVGLLSMEGDLASELLLAIERAEAAPSTSRDGNWIAHASSETGQLGPSVTSNSKPNVRL